MRIVKDTFDFDVDSSFSGFLVELDFIGIYARKINRWHNVNKRMLGLANSKWAPLKYDLQQEIFNLNISISHIEKLI